MDRQEFRAALTEKIVKTHKCLAAPLAELTDDDFFAAVEGGDVTIVSGTSPDGSTVAIKASWMPGSASFATIDCCTFSIGDGLRSMPIAANKIDGYVAQLSK